MECAPRPSRRTPWTWFSSMLRVVRNIQSRAVHRTSTYQKTVGILDIQKYTTTQYTGHNYNNHNLNTSHFTSNPAQTIFTCIANQLHFYSPCCPCANSAKRGAYVAATYLAFSFCILPRQALYQTPAVSTTWGRKPICPSSRHRNPRPARHEARPRKIFSLSVSLVDMSDCPSRLAIIVKLFLLFSMPHCSSDSNSSRSRLSPTFGVDVAEVRRASSYVAG